jgi:hypothetical protein
LSSRLVVARSGSKIGSNLNWTELNAAFKFKVRNFVGPEHQVRFGIQAYLVGFEPNLNLNLKPQFC